MLGMYTSTERLPLYDIEKDEQIPEGLDCGEITIQSQAGPLPNPLDVNFGDQIRLVGYAIEPRQLRAGETFALTLHWEKGETVDINYDVFAQVLDNNWKVWGSKDGGHPDWYNDGIITETRVITLLPDVPPGTYPIQVGLYHSEGRLPIITTDGNHLDDRFFLGPIRVE